MRTNSAAVPVAPTFNSEGVPTDRHTPALTRLERSVMSCLLWEDSFYESGEAIAERISRLAGECEPEAVASLAIQARTQMRLRSVPLLLAAALTRKRWPGVADLLPQIILRADELTEFLAVWSKLDERTGAKTLNRLPKAVVRGLDAALRKFGEPALARNLAEGRAIKLRDVIRLIHPKPDSPEQAALWKGVLEGTLRFPDTWQTRLAAGGDPRETWTELLVEQRLGALDILKNLRNMHAAGVGAGLVATRLRETAHKVDLPFRYIQAARAVPEWEGFIEQAMLVGMEGREKLKGRTLLLVDVSGSMDGQLSSGHKSGSDPMRRVDAACALAILLREICEEVAVVTFSLRVVAVPPRRGMTLRDAINQSQRHSSTDLRRALMTVSNGPAAGHPDRLIIITDEESQTNINGLGESFPRRYMLDVASTQRGIGTGPWVRISGFSEAVVDYIQAFERQG